MTRLNLINRRYNNTMTIGQGHVLFSSNASNSLKCRSFFVNANNAASNSNANIDSGSLLVMRCHQTPVLTNKVKYTTTLHYVLVEKSKTQE